MTTLNLTFLRSWHLTMCRSEQCCFHAELTVCLISVSVSSTSCWTKYFSCKLGFKPPKLDCQSELGMKSGKISHGAITATTSYNQYYGPERARLDTVKTGSFIGAWVPKTQDMGQWIQVDLGKYTKITRIATQGRQDAAQWVKSYSIAYSAGESPFILYNNNQVWMNEWKVY